MKLELFLISWTAVAAIWWMTSLITLMRVRKDSFQDSPPADSSPPFLTIFKPIPILESDHYTDLYMECLGSFVQQLDERSELLLGIFHSELERWQPMLDRWRGDYPQAHWRVIVRESQPGNTLSNAKISWQRILAKQARGEWWLWSDVDILAPPGYLGSLRSEFSANGSTFLTSPYVIRRIGDWNGMLDALFVNVELYPGTRLLGQRGAIHFGLGAGMLFRRDQFKQRIEWQKLGAVLADDFYLGNQLQPAYLGSAVLETFSSSRNLQETLAHYLRWQKTICWCQPQGFASQLLVLPMLGWMISAVLLPNSWSIWLGIGIVVAFELAWVSNVFQLIECKLKKRWLGVIVLWSFLRPLVWLACWLPWPVRWRSQLWWSREMKTSAA